jgi:hypothetical protein
MTEDRLLRNIIGPKNNNLCDSLHWRGFHARSGLVWKEGQLEYRTAVQGGGTGFPDLVLVSLRPWHPQPRVLYRELKSDRGGVVSRPEVVARHSEGRRCRLGDLETKGLAADH